MSESKTDIIKKFDETMLVRIVPGKSTLPIDTSAEWTKGFMLVNELIKELAEGRYKEKFTDEFGDEHELTKLHPQLLSYIAERRKMMDQIWKISGGEAVNEAKKETAKNFAKMIFNSQMDRQTKMKYKNLAEKIIEIEEEENYDEH